jgi:membrane-associated protease RseP (regulator of RpoE activity)
MNLFPVGQLDGGHVVYAVFGPRARRWARYVLAAFVFMGVFFFAGWLLWAVLIAVLGLRHPPVMDEPVPLSDGRRWLGYLVLAVFALSFTPSPIQGSSILDLLRQLLMWPPGP